MKTNFTNFKRFLFFLAFVLSNTCYILAQAPEKFSYQAVVRDASNNLIIEQTVGIQITIQQGSPGGTNVYQETHTEMTNVNGLVSLEIGGGMSTMMGEFSDIDWGNGPYFIQTDVDPTGGVDYTVTGNSQLLSVPYALYAGNAKTYAIGDTAFGGNIFWVAESGVNGLVCALNDGMSQWGTQGDTVHAKRTGIGAGIYNTERIINHEGEEFNYAANIIALTGFPFGDWYLPSIYEMQLIRDNIGGNAPGPLNNAGDFQNEQYWTSNEDVDGGDGMIKAVTFNPINGAQLIEEKDETRRFRAVRRF
ncbi:MAG TPA: hypothetical protein PKC30_08560 [Saprospiraceae bacterium]|nr:hypothetical protein [Saprospiraceae bacterium]